MNKHNLFNNISIVSCGILKPEIDALREEGFLNAKKIFFTSSGLHEWPWELKKQLPNRLEKAREYSDNIIVLYGERCFMDSKDPSRVTDVLIKETNPKAVRIHAANCIDMLADSENREKFAKGNKVYWITPGWIKYWDFIFKDWDKGKANEMFPYYDKAVVLDALGYYEKLSIEDQEKILKIADWMKIPLESVNISLDRFKELLKNSAEIMK